MSVMLQCRGLVCRLGHHLVLEDANLELREGESLALLGTSGCGKSTLLRIIAGLELPEGGEVVISKEVVTKDSRLIVEPQSRGISMLFQDLALWPNLSVAGNVQFGLSGKRMASKRMSSQETQERVHESLAMCGIAELADRRPGTLSGGQQQRVALARALAVRPKLLLLDEPFGGLDLLTKESVLQQLARLRSRLGFAQILVTHDPQEVKELCASVAVLENGQIVEQGPLSELATKPRTLLAKALVAQLHAGECSK